MSALGRIILPSGASPVNVRSWPTADDRLPTAGGPLPVPLLTLPRLWSNPPLSDVDEAIAGIAMPLAALQLAT
jgi:hypothetical protein